MFIRWQDKKTQNILGYEIRIQCRTTRSEQRRNTGWNYWCDLWTFASQCVCTPLSVTQSITAQSTCVEIESLLVITPNMKRATPVDISSRKVGIISDRTDLISAHWSITWMTENLYRFIAQFYCYYLRKRDNLCQLLGPSTAANNCIWNIIRNRPKCQFCT